MAHHSARCHSSFENPTRLDETSPLVKRAGPLVAGRSAESRASYGLVRYFAQTTNLILIDPSA